MYEAQFLVEEGATPEQVDRGADRLRHGDGDVRRRRHGGPRRRLARAPGARPLQRARRAAAAGRTTAGRDGTPRAEDRQGLVHATTTTRKPTPDPEVVALIDRATAADAGIRAARVHERGDRRARDLRADQRRRAGARGRRRRCAPSDIDVIYVNGYGFPALARRADVLCRSRRARRRSTSASRPSIASLASAGRRRRCSSGWRARARRSASSIDRATRRLGRMSRALRGRHVPRDAGGPPPPDTVVHRRDPDGTAARPVAPRLGPYPERITERLEHWAADAPDRTLPRGSATRERRVATR